MKRDFNALTSETFDLIVVGGGIMGAGIARDAALRGIHTLLLEKNDFASGTTSRSSRLIHGGLRYLQQYDFGLVRQGLREREILLSIASHLVHPCPFIVPINSTSQRMAMAFGLPLYDLLAFGKSLPSRQRLTRHETIEMEPDLELKELKGSYLYYDCQAPFVERLCLENVIAAAELGASVVNYTEVTGVLREGSSLSGVHVRDTLSGETHELRGHLVVNATGHWVDSVLKMMGAGQSPAMRRSKGIHIITPQISRHAVAMFSIAKGTHFFIIPWMDYSLIGITDTEYSGDPDIVEATTEDVVYVIEGVREAFPSLELGNVLYTMAGLRALADSGNRSTRDLSRKYEVVDHEKRDGVGGLISVLGGKITTYRAVAEDTMNLVCHKLGSKTPSSTTHIPLPGAPSPSQEAMEQTAYESGLTMDTITHLANLYGSRYHRILDLVKNDAQGGQNLCPHSPDIIAQIWYSIDEGASTITDFLLRRSTMGMRSCQGLDAADTVAREMGRLLEWSPEEQQRQVEHYRMSAALGQGFRGRDEHRG